MAKMAQKTQPLKTKGAEIVKILLSTAIFVLVTALWAPPPSHAQPPTFRLNLKNADMRSLVEAVSKYTGKNFILDRDAIKVKGFNVITSSPLNADAIYDIFLSILETVNMAVVEREGIAKIVKGTTANRTDIPFFEDREGSYDDYVTRIVQTENIGASEAAKTLKSYIRDKSSHIKAYNKNNLLIISGRRANIGRILRILEKMDVYQEDDIAIVKLEYAQADPMRKVLAKLAPKQTARQKARGNKNTILAYPRENSLVFKGSEEYILAMRILIAQLDVAKKKRNSATEVVFLRYSSAKELAEVAKKVVKQQNQVINQLNPTDSTEKKKERETFIEAHLPSNALIITAPAEQMADAISLIERLDIRRAQVLVEAIIADVSENKTRELGVNPFIRPEAGRPAIISGLGDASSDLLQLGALSGRPSGIPPGLTAGIASLSGSTQFGVLIRAIASDTDSNILSTPRILTLDNQAAEIIVGQNVPFITGSTTTSGGDPFQTIERRDIGVSLKVKPQISAGDTVILEIEQEVSSISRSSDLAGVNASDIILSKRTIKTSILAENDQIVILGGLTQETVTDEKQKIPLIGDVPLLGRLFQFRSSVKVKQNLMVFLHPVIVSDSQSLSKLTSEKYDDFQQERARRQGLSDSFFKDELPSLPPINVMFEGTRNAPENTGGNHRSAP